jgi:D-3-phosphoglycerate dehydrogenase
LGWPAASPSALSFSRAAHLIQIHKSNHQESQTMAPRVLISDELSETAVEIFRSRGIDVTFEPKLGKDKDKLLSMIGDYDGLAIRSATKATDKLIAAATNLKVIGRAGIGVDNVDIPAATARGIIVMNTPFGNSITTAEHAISMMLACARQIPAADASTQAGKWEKSRFMGVEVTAKTLGLIGCGNIGSIVADRAIGLKMKVIAYDPFLTEERAIDLGVEKVELEALLKRADFITLHVPKTEKTANILSADAINRMKPGVRIINCARGGLVDEVALRAALDSGHVAGAAFDVFSEEPATENVLFGAPNLVCTPHLGAATTEAQENVALQVAEQMADFLTTGAVTNALNSPSISAEEAPRLKPFVQLAELIGSFAGQLTETAIEGITIEYAGDIADLNTKALSSAALAGVLRPLLSSINVVSAPAIAKERGIAVEETKRGQEGAYETYMRLTVKTERQTRAVAGTVFADGKPRLIQVKGIDMEGSFSEHMLYVTNKDKPGFIGRLGSLLGAENINIATFNLGRAEKGDDAIALVQVDEPVSDSVLEKIAALEGVVQAKRLRF